jgi:hypothetical protein
LSGSNVDANDSKNGNHEKQDDRETTTDGVDMESNYLSSKSTPERWIIVLALIILASGVVLLTLRSVIFSLVFITIGISLFSYWLYLGAARSKERLHLVNEPDVKTSSAKFRVKEGESICTCSICQHEESKACMRLKCPCCILTRNKQIIGHFNNPLQ